MNLRFFAALRWLAFSRRLWDDQLHRQLWVSNTMASARYIQNDDSGFQIETICLLSSARRTLLLASAQRCYDWHRLYCPQRLLTPGCMSTARPLMMCCYVM